MMSAMSNSLANDIRNIASSVQSAKVSTTKWRPIGDVLAEALSIHPENVYVTTVSKPGNLTVRMEQSARARDAVIVAAMYTGNQPEIAACVVSAQKRSEPGRQILIFADNGAGMTLEAIVKQASDSVPAVLAAAYPTATVVDC
jgi:hypothetical protein